MVLDRHPSGVLTSLPCTHTHKLLPAPGVAGALLATSLCSCGDELVVLCLTPASYELPKLKETKVFSQR